MAALMRESEVGRLNARLSASAALVEPANAALVRRL